MRNIEHVSSSYDHCNILPQIIPVIKPACEPVLVLDGNMKNARQVCSCRDVGELQFAGMDGSQLLLITSNLIIILGHTVFTEAS